MGPISQATRFLLEMEKGDPAAAERLLPLVYEEIRRLAGRFMRRERGDHTLQPTALVHEAYLKLVDQDRVAWRNRAHFVGVAAQAMRRVLVDHARRRGREKRGGDRRRIPLEGIADLSPEAAGALEEVDAALERLARLDPRQARIVELRFFGGLDVQEIADALEVSKRTVEADWTMARAWLSRELERS